MPTGHFSFRIPDRERKLLEEQAEYREVSESELARRYVAEGIRRDRHPRVTFQVGRVGGRPALASRPRLEVATIVETWMMEDQDEDAVARYHEISPADVRAALDYYSEFRGEVDAALDQKRRIAQRYEKIAQARRKTG